MIDLERGPVDQDSLSTDQEGWAASAEFLQEIVELTTMPLVQPGDITVAMLTRYADIHQNTARDRLDALVRRGVLETPEGLRRRPEDNRRVRVWRKAQE